MNLDSLKLYFRKTYFPANTHESIRVIKFYYVRFNHVWLFT